MPRHTPAIKGRYLHYKNIPVTVLGIAKHSETEEELVMYLHEDTGEYWVRPRTMFFENVTIDGTVMPRFKKLEE
jgi:hypothetical protein